MPIIVDLLPYANTVVHGDALDVLKLLPDVSIDAVVTDPPFGIGFQYEEVEEHTTSSGYWNWFSPIYNEMDRILKPGGFMAIWQAQKHFRHFWDWYGDDIHIYAACRNFIQIRKTPFNYAYDPVVMRYKAGAPPLRPENPPQNKDFFVANVAGQVSKTDSIAREHPCPRPLDAVEEVIKNFVLPGGIVIDPFLGSGTTAEAALVNGRTFIGIEKNATYFNICLRRIARYDECISF